MKTRIAIVASVLLLMGIVLQRASATTINEVELGATASATPTSVGSSTPVPVLHCSSTLNANNPKAKTQTQYVHVCAKGGTAGTDGLYCSWAPPASPCAAASPAPNSSTGVGIPIPSGGSFYSCQDINYPSANGGQSAAVLSQEFDCVGTTAITVNRTTFP